ncbi:MAG: tetratricopeptide repeat protein [Betaproteobacteria bacterium]|nr:tetratricopeptide repeat protein [Betaproteobacteria bacterium]
MKQAAAGIAAVVALAIAASGPAMAQEKVRPEVGKPLQAASDFLKANKFREALAKIREADAVGGKTPYETYVIESMRGSAAAGARDNATAIAAFEAVLATGKAPAATQQKIYESLATTYYGMGKYADAIKYANKFKESGGGSGGTMRTLLIQSYFQSGDFAASAKESLADIQADERAGRTPAEEKLQLLANSYLRQKNTSGYVATIEKLLTYYPKKSLWQDIISRLQQKPGFSDRFSLDVQRLRLATGNLSATNDFMEMAQLAIQAGYATEGKKIVDDGFAVGALGKGNDAERHKRLRDLAEKRVAEAKATRDKDLADAKAAKDGNALVRLGYAYVTSGEGQKGVALIEEGIAKGGLKRPEDAKLYLGMAQIQAGNKSKGIATLKSVKGNDGVADLANLWALFAQQKNG